MSRNNTGADAVVDLNNELKTRREAGEPASRGLPSRTISVAIIPLTNCTQNSDGKENEELEALNIEVACWPHDDPSYYG